MHWIPNPVKGHLAPKLDAKYGIRQGGIGRLKLQIIME